MNGILGMTRSGGNFSNAGALGDCLMPCCYRVQWVWVNKGSLAG